MWGIGTRFQLKESEEWVDVAGVKNITPPGITTDMADATVLYSSENKKGFEEKQPTIHRLGDSVITLLFEPDDEDQKDLLGKQIEREKLNCRILFPDERNYYEFAAYLSGFELGDINPEGLLEATATFSTSGEPAFDSDPPGGNTKLQSLTIGAIALSPSFNPNALGYTGATNETKDKITAVQSDPLANVAITLNGTSAPNESDLSWITSGQNTVVVTVSKGAKATSYVIVITHS